MEKPTTPVSDTTAILAAEHWRELEARTGGSALEDEEYTPSYKPEVTVEDERKRVFLGRARLVVPTTLVAFAVALSWIAVPMLVGGGSRHRSQPAPLVLPGKADKRRPGRARWVKEAGESAQPRQRRVALGDPHARRHTHLRHEPRRPGPQPGAPSQPPASGATAPEPSAPATPPPAEPAGNPGLRDGATESSEFGL